MVSRKDVVLEIQSMLPSLRISGGWQVAKAIRDLAEMPPETWRRIGARGMKRPMVQSEAARIVSEAERRIALADAPD